MPKALSLALIAAGLTLAGTASASVSEVRAEALQVAEPISVAVHARTAPLAIKPSKPEPSAPPEWLSCELRHGRRGGTQVVLALVQANAPMESKYKFSVGSWDAKRNAELKSESGSFQTLTREQVELKRLSVKFWRGAALIARLELRDRDDRFLVACILRTERPEAGAVR